MAEQADVYVKNLFTGKTIEVIRNLPGCSDPAVTIGSGDTDRFYIESHLEEQFYLGGTDISLTINAPVGMDTKECFFSLQSDVDLNVIHSRTDSSWTIQILPNKLPPDTPTTVNITIGSIGE